MGQSKLNKQKVAQKVVSIEDKKVEEVPVEDKKVEEVPVEDKKVDTKRKDFLEKKKVDYTKVTQIASVLDAERFSIEVLEKALDECKEKEVEPTALYISYSDLPALKESKDFISGMDDVDTLDLVEVGTYKDLTVYTDSFVHPYDYFISKTKLV